MAGELRPYFLTFDSWYAPEPHPSFPDAHPDGWVRILAPDWFTARDIAWAHVGAHWRSLSRAYDRPPRDDFPRGELAVWAASTRVATS